MSHSPLPADSPRIAPWTIWIPIIFMALGVVVFFNWASSQALKKDDGRPPYSYKLERDLELIEKTGKPVTLNQLKGKVILASHFYSTCPMGCAVLAERMKTMRDEFKAKYPDLQLISFAIDPGDTPEHLTKFAKESYGVEPTDDSWWFVTGDQKIIRNYLTLQFKFLTLREKPVKERTSEVDKYEHDMRIALVDRQANVRGLYDLMSKDPELAAMNEKKLRKHLAYILAEE
jgi:protein SCO1